MTKKSNIFIKNIYYMLSYAFSILRESNFEDVETESFDNALDLLAAILSKGIGQQIKQGLFREYSIKTETLHTLRGKLDLNDTIKLLSKQERMLACEFDELSENTELNQILKTTCQLLIKSPQVDQQRKNELKKAMMFFTGIDPIQLIDIRWEGMRFHRSNRTYRMLISICRLILDGMLLTTEKGDLRLASFLDESQMCRLYERFLFEYYRKEYPNLQVTASKIKWDVDDDVVAFLPEMHTDVTISNGKQTLILDAKYYEHTTQYHHDKYSVHSSNLYQIYAYVKNHQGDPSIEPNSVSGLLLYAGTNEVVQPNIEYQLSGNRISVKSLDLNQYFGSIRTQLNSIIQSNFS